MLDNIIQPLGDFLENYGNFFLLVTITILFLVFKFRSDRRALSLVVLTEQCLASLMYYSLFSTPFILKISLGFLYMGTFLAAGLIGNGTSTRIISKIYFGVGAYHFLLALEPLFVKWLFVNTQNIVYYIDSLHLLINFSANIVILGLVVFGGSVGGSRKRGIYADCFRRTKYSDNYRNSIANQNKQAE